MPMYARGSIAKGMCQRCGLQFLLPELRFDGYYPNLRVCDGCYDPPQPQEKLAIVSDPEGLWRPAPDDYLVTAPLLVITAGPSSAQPIGLEEGGGGIFEQEGGEGYLAAEGGSSGAYILNWSGFNVAGPEITVDADVAALPATSACGITHTVAPPEPRPANTPTARRWIM